MSIWSLKRDYLDRIADIFKEAAAEVAKDAVKLDELQAKHAGVWSDVTLNMEGKHRASAQYADGIHRVQRHIQGIQAEARKEAMKVRGEVERDFHDYFNANVADFDEKTAAFVNSGLATDAELLNLAKTASRTMKRVIGAKLAESKDSTTAFYGRVMQQESYNPHLQAVDNLIKAGGYAVGQGGSGPAGASYFLQRWDEAVQPIYSACPNVGYSITSAGERRYFEGTQPE